MDPDLGFLVLGGVWPHAPLRTCDSPVRPRPFWRRSGTSIYSQIAVGGGGTLSLTSYRWPSRTGPCDRRGGSFVSRPDESSFGDLTDRMVSIGDLRQHFRTESK